ncbi:BTAD domain-containing putative transcriptional regulator [Actinosynnema sp. NPDC020468]|uniref:AfsR/SARP family transcriptional regulator n=1 Tax=Actinosynnema sp. NPDC020468 TaxID=3154488 RepID=UPI0033C85025
MEFRVLGPLEVRASGEVVRVPGARQQRLLALLLLNANRVVPVDRLVEELWEQPPRSVRQQVHNAVGSLRALLTAPGGGVGITRADVGYRLDVPEDAVDAHLFARTVREAARPDRPADDAIALLTEALALWRGDALAGLDGRAITGAAAGLDEQRLAAVEELMALRLDRGEAGGLIADLRRLVADHPLRESLRGHLMRALHRCGRQAEALEVYDQGRRTLAEELGLDPGPRLRSLHAEILAERDQPRAAVATAEPPRQARATRSYLPHDIRDFSGRSAELVRLLAETRGVLPTALVITAIDGMGGVGKTTLAVHLGHQVADDYPDGQFFIDLHGFSPGVDPVTPEQALDALLRDSGVPPELVPYGLEGRAARWRSAMAGRRALLILDNAIDAAHVRPLLPGAAGVLVVVTSRRKLAALDGAVPMSLDVLPAADAVALFTRVAGPDRVAAEPEAAATAVELCGRLPLAIRIAAARLRDRGTWTVSDLVDRLASRRMRFLQVDGRSVSHVLTMSYRYLPGAQQRLFRLLSLHPGTDFDPHAAAALADCPPEQAEFLLDALFDANLLKQSTTGRFYFHDLVRDCAHQILTETEDEAQRRTALHRLLDYYALAAHHWSRDLDNRVYPLPPRVDHRPEVPPAPTAQDAIALLRTEYRNLMAVARFAAEHDWHDHAWQLACFLQPALRDRNYGEGSAEVFDRGLRAARRTGDVRGEAACLQGLAAVCRERGSTEEAAAHLRAALEIGRTLGDRECEAAQLVELGNLHLAEERLDEAHGAFAAAGDLVADLPDSPLGAAIANNLGVVHRDLGRYDEALAALRKALRAKGSERFPQAELLTAWSIGAVRHYQGAHDDAVREFSRILRESEQRGFEHGEAVAVLGLSAARRALGLLDESLALGRRSLALARKLDLPLLECEALNAIGETTFALGEPEQAEKVFTQAVEYARQYDAPRYRARALEGLAHTAMRRGETGEARRCWESAVRLYPRGMADAEYARVHLAGAPTCFRCAVQSTSHSGR